MTSVSLVIPCFNEKEYISGFIEKILSMDFSFYDVSIVVADGMSNDGTRDILFEKASKDKRIYIIDNVKRIVSSGLNLAILFKKSEYIIRLDVHTLYEDDYIIRCIEALNGNLGNCVGGAWNIDPGNDLVSRAISTAFSSPFGSGGATSRDVSFNGKVDTVYLGAWRRLQLIKYGMFDENFVRNQDDELCLRIIKSGGVIYQSSSIKSKYFGRQSFKKLYMQFYQYGFWKPFVMAKHREIASIRHLAPFLFVISTFTLAIISLPATAIFLFLYFLMISISIIVKKHKLQISLIMLSTICVCIIHVAYGFGSIKGLLCLGLHRGKIVNGNISISR
jgi:succinoglycan biosynthesis protein ExoA